jgi:hypothetical protein
MMPSAWARRTSVHVGPLRRGAGRSEQGPYRRRACPEAELPQLALDPDAAPARVLPGEAEDEGAELRIDRRPARATGPAIGPLPAYELAVPSEQRRRGDEEGDPSITRDCPAGRREQDPVNGLELRSARRPLQHPELVAQDEDLEVLGAVVPVTPAGADDAGDEETDEQVEEDGATSVDRTGLIRARIEVSDPHGNARYL